MEKIMGATLVAAGFGMTAFRIRHFISLSLTKLLNPSTLQSLKGHSILEFQQLHQPWINQNRFAIAVLQIPVLPAVRAQAFAVLTADRFHGQAQQNLLPRDIVNLDEVT
jgi:hypothetical protein